MTTEQPPTAPVPESGGGLVARQLLELRQETAQLRRRLHALPDQDALQSMVDQLGVLAERVEALEEQAQSGADDSKIKVWDWSRFLTEDSPESRAAQAELVHWVQTVLGDLYGLVGYRKPWPNDPPGSRLIPPCWREHLDLVVELSWLCQEWHRIYRTSKGTPAQAGDWHDRYLPGVRRRVAVTSAGDCHQKHAKPEPDPPPRSW